jgi:signal transduction histidine kinase
MVKWINSIRQQILALLLWLTLGLTVAYTAIAITAAFIVEDELLSNVLDEQATLVEQHYRETGNLPALPFDYLDVYPSLDAAPDWMRARLRRDSATGEIFSPGKAHYHYKKLNLGEVNLGESDLGEESTAYLVAEVSNLLVVTKQRSLLPLFLLVFLMAIAIAAVLATKLANRIVDPLLALTDTIKANAQTGNRAPLPKLKFELGYLSATLQQSFDRLDAALEREKAFSTNVSHELRTPLAVIRNSCLLINQRGLKDGDLKSLSQSAEQMESIIDVLLGLAREDALDFRACNFNRALEQAILDSRYLPENFHVDINIPATMTVNANPRLLELLLSNLLRNAAEHASEPKCVVREVEGSLSFENETAYALGDGATHAGVKNPSSSGVGQGLYLVSRIAEKFGWRFTVEWAEGRFRALIDPR